MPTIAIYADTRGRGRCRAQACGVVLTWAEVVATGKRMCFDGDPVALRTRHEPETHRLIEELDLADNHWQRCPGAPSFRRPRA